MKLLDEHFYKFFQCPHWIWYDIYEDAVKKRQEFANGYAVSSFNSLPADQRVALTRSAPKDKEEVLDRIKMKRRELDVSMDRFTNQDLFSGKVDRCRPILKEFA